MSGRFKQQVLLLLLLLLTTAGLLASAVLDAPLVCTDAAGARLLFKGACERDLACRFEVVDNARVGGSSAAWDASAPVSARIDDTLFNLTTRAFFEPAAWLDAPLLVVNASDAAAQDCGALAAALNTTAPPLAVRGAVATFVHYQSYVAEDGQCSDLNTVAVLAADGALTCQCLPDKVCQPSGQTRLDGLLFTVLVLTILVVVGQFVAVVAFAAPRHRPTKSA